MLERPEQTTADAADKLYPEYLAYLGWMQSSPVKHLNWHIFPSATASLSSSFVAFRQRNDDGVCLANGFDTQLWQLLLCTTSYGIVVSMRIRHFKELVELLNIAHVRLSTWVFHAALSNKHENQLFCFCWK